MWEGRVIDGIFPLQQLLGETDHSAVFLTEHGDGEAKKKAAIKLVGAQPASADTQLAIWNFAAHITHPNLLKLFRCGRCSVGGNDLLYVVMEYAEEDLADILPQRALTAEETRDMLLPVLDALEFLHGKGLVHRGIKPANILASGDELKLSSDTIARVGEGLSLPKKTDAYDPPEAVSHVVSTGGDVWSLGTTLVEVLTQKLPDWEPGANREPVVPANVPPPFAEIVRHCLRLEPDRRVRIADIAARLNPRAAAAAAAAAAPGVATRATELNRAPRQPVTPLANLPKPVFSPPTGPREPVQRVDAPLVRPETFGAPPSKPRFIVPVIVGALVFAAVVTVPRLVTQRPSQRSTAGDVSQNSAGPDRTGSKAEATTAVARPALKADRKMSGDKVPPPATGDSAAIPSTASTKEGLKATRENELPKPEAVASSTAVSEVAAKTAPSARAAKGEVLDQILPDVSQKARDSIRGRVRVGVKLHVDSAGAVSEAELDSPGPSKYFADLALQAAKKWAFTPPDVDGKSAASEWIVQFVFTQDDTKVTATQTTP